MSDPMKLLAVCLGLTLWVSTGALPSHAQVRGRTAGSDAAARRVNVPYGDVRLILEALRDDLVPAELRARNSAERARFWPRWVSDRDTAIRARMARGDEDSIFNFLLLGTTFTTAQRVTNVVASLEDAEGAKIVERRLDDLVAGVGSPNDNERLRFVREAVERAGIQPATAAGARQTKVYFGSIIARVIPEREAHERAILSAKQLPDPLAALATHSTLYRDRGLSLDTSLFPSFAIERALDDIKSRHTLMEASVRRVAIVGPGLDFTDKEDGYDTYPLQTIQPFATIDSLIRLGLAVPDDLQITTFDLSSRVNHHLQAAQQRARAGDGYVLSLPRNMTERWNEPLVDYWQRMGDRIGSPTQAVVPPLNAGDVRIRAVRVRPDVVTSIAAQDLNVVLQRLEQADARDDFDLIIATNVLVYYDVFEQSLAVANLAKMLRRGGLLLSNNFIYELGATPMTFVGELQVGYTDSGDGDRIMWYERQ
jgi:hypothetical protein